VSYFSKKKITMFQFLIFNIIRMFIDILYLFIHNLLFKINII